MKAPRKRRPTTDAVEILHRRYFEGKPARLAALEEERANAEIARKIYELRTKAELTQQQLARLVGTSTSVICRLEDALRRAFFVNVASDCYGAQQRCRDSVCAH